MTNPSVGGPLEAELVPLTGIRRVIATNLPASLQSTAQVTSFFDVDATALVRARDQLRSRGDMVGYDAILVAAAARALRRVRIVNAHIADGQIVFPVHVNVGVAVALDESFGIGGALIVPVIFDADTKSAPQISADLAEKVARARAKRLGPTDVQRGTFTISNLGGLPGSGAWRGATPVINGNQGAILAVGRVRDAAVVIDGAVAVQPLLALALTHDHRLIDGAPAGAFIEELVGEFAHAADYAAVATEVHAAGVP